MALETTATDATTRRDEFNDLLDRLVALSFAIHATDARAHDWRSRGRLQRAGSAEAEADDLRGQRDMVRGELLRRAGA